MTPPVRATGYVYDAHVIAANVRSLITMGVDLAPTPLLGECDRARDAGVAYHNLRDYEREFFSTPQPSFIRTGRRLTVSGVLQPISQRTGICVGCAFSLAQWLAWVARFMSAGDVPGPQEVSLVAPYLLGRGNLRGDTGAYPSHSARGSHDYGVLTVDALARGLKLDPERVTTESQESIAVAYRENPMGFDADWLNEMKPLTTRVYMPVTYAEVADCIAANYPVTIGMGWQIAESYEGDGMAGVSRFYRLNGGHETVLDGWFTRQGRLGFLKSESWGDFPSSKWLNKRVRLQTDAGMRTLYEGQGACWASELWNTRPECWAISFPGSVS